MLSRAARLAVAWSVLGATLMAARAQSTAPSGVRSVQFVAIVPDMNRAQPKQVYLATSRDAWAPDARTLTRVARGLYSASFEFEPGQVEFKFTRDGSWATVEKSADGGEIANRIVNVEPGVEELVVVQRIAGWAGAPLANKRRVELNEPGGAARPLESTLSGDIRFHHRFHSPQLKNARTLAVYLPPGYDAQPRRRFPVLYLHDGQNVFDARTSFTGVEWGADETAGRLIEEAAIEPLIIVGIFNNADRIDEYTPFADGDRRGGNGAAYLAFLTETVKPFIDEHYRTRPARAHTAIGGSSLGGLISLYALHARPDVFSKAAVVSPSLRWADAAVLAFAREHPLRPGAGRVWLDMGTQEGTLKNLESLYSSAVEACRELTAIWGASGLTAPADFRFEEVAGGRHHETDWAKRFDKILTYLFPAEPDGE